MICKKHRFSFLRGGGDGQNYLLMEVSNKKSIAHCSGVQRNEQPKGDQLLQGLRPDSLGSASYTSSPSIRFCKPTSCSHHTPPPPSIT